MMTLRLGTDSLALYAYRYQGARPLGPTPDAFQRTGWALRSLTGKSRASLLVQAGEDSSANGLGTAVSSSGGFLQEEWSFSDRVIGVVRYDGTASSDETFLRSTTLALIFRPFARVRLTLEDVVSHQPSTTNTLNLGWLFAY